MPRIRLKVNPSGGLFDFSEQYPGADFAILSAYPIDGRLLMILKAEFESPHLIIQFFEDSDVVQDLEVRHQESDRVIVAYSLPFIPPPVEALFNVGELPRFPVRIKDGNLIAEMTTSHERISAFKAELESTDVHFEVLSITQSESLEDRLTDRQIEFVQIALKLGYYDTPRRCSLTEVAEECNVSAATMSTVLHRAEETIVKDAFVDMEHPV